MFWTGVYVVVALLVAAGVFVVGEFVRGPDVPAPRRPGVVALGAGLLWPVLLVAGAQGALIMVMGRRVQRSATSAARFPEPAVG